MQGARAVQTAIVHGFPDADVGVMIVWANMLRWDNALTARVRALSMRDRRVHHFHDPNRCAGKAIAQVLGGQGKVAWDIYLFYPPASEWRDAAPPPTAWAHQLQPSTWADPAHFHTGRDLVEQLRSIMATLVR